MENIIPFLIQHGYTVVFVWVFAETMGLPLPSPPLLITVGTMAGVGELNLFLCIGAGVCAALVSDLFWFVMGRRRGGKVLSLVCRISLEPDSCVRQTVNIFSRYGGRSLLVTKFLPWFGAVSTPMAGITGMRLWRFLMFDGLGVIIWISSYTLLGYIFSRELDRVLDYAAGTGKTLSVLLASGLALYIIRKYTLRRRILRELYIARITPEELKQKLDAGEDVVIIDLRHELDFINDPYIIPGALRIPLEEVARHPVVSSDREVVAYCTCPNEASSAQVVLRLFKGGVTRIRPLAGGFHAWRDRDYPVQLVEKQKT
jgi:membrane protein DedA with SNARE-associated domain/rhodanese-related sulfurtransferase